MDALADRLRTLTTAELADVCCELMNDFRDGADAVFTAAFCMLQSRMTSAEFLALCSQLEAAT